MTLFSFDSFSTTPEVTSLTYPNMQAIITNTTKLAALITNVVTPLAKAVASSPNSRRMIAWDIINEPEWAVSGNGAAGDQAFSPNASLTTVDYTTMHTFINDVATALRANSSSLITVGNAAIKWKNAWTDIDQDFFTYHLYGWVQPYWPYTNTAASYTLAKPIVIGEFPFTLDTNNTTPDYTYSQVTGGLFNEGYAGAVVWETGTNEARGTINLHGPRRNRYVPKLADDHATVRSHALAALVARVIVAVAVAKEDEFYATNGLARAR